jgi:hypothetical protein
MASSKRKKPQADQPQHSDGPWDVEAAEALMRAYETSEAEWRESRSARRLPNDRGREAPAEPAREGSASLEGRLADIADRLQRSIAGIDPDKSATALGQRIHELEERLAATFDDVAQRLEGRTLDGIEAQFGGLGVDLEHIRGQLSRLDAIDDRLRDLAGQLDQGRLQPAPSRLSDGAIEAMIDAAADRAARRVAEAFPPAAPAIDPARLDAVEQQLREQMAERRHAEDMTAGVLRSIEEGLARILDRVEAMEPASLASLLPDSRTMGPAETSPFDPLLEAYARGARALGQSAPASMLDAADYPGDAPQAPARDSRAPADDAEPKEPALPRLDPAASAAGPDTPKPPPLPTGPIDNRLAIDPAAKRRGEPKSFTDASGWRSSLLLLLAMSILFGSGYLAVDRFLAQAQLPMPQDRTAAQTTDNPSAAAHFVPVAASASETEAVRGDVIAPQDGARPEDMAGLLPAEIGAASLRQAAANGDAVAQFEVASRYAAGRGVAQNDAEAYTWFQRSAMRGFVPAQFRLAGLLERGVGVAADVERAKVWYRRAAEQGHVKAMHNLAVLSAKKEASLSDYATAAKWFREAAERGLTDSQYNLALLCQKGLGVSRNLAQSYKWFALAARGGDKEAAIRLEQVKALLDPADLAAAEEMVASWRMLPTAAAGQEPAIPSADATSGVGG